LPSPFFDGVLITEEGEERFEDSFSIEDAAAGLLSSLSDLSFSFLAFGRTRPPPRLPPSFFVDDMTLLQCDEECERVSSVGVTERWPTEIGGNFSFVENSDLAKS
jgi:hypothetical protein